MGLCIQSTQWEQTEQHKKTRQNISVLRPHFHLLTLLPPALVYQSHSSVM